MPVPRKSLKPVYVQTAGQVRILVWPNRRGGSAQHSVVSIERTQDSAAPRWYPSASFGATDLADLESLLPVVRAYLDGTSPRTEDDRMEGDGPEARVTAQTVDATPKSAPEGDDNFDSPEEPSPDSSTSPATDTVPLSDTLTEKLVFPPADTVLPIARGHGHGTTSGRIQWTHRAIIRLRTIHQARMGMSRD